MVKGITSILAANSTIRTLVGQNVAADRYKVYPVICPMSETPPYLVVIQTGKTPIECKDAPTTYEYTYDVYAVEKNYDDAETLSNAVEAALDRKTPGTYNGVVFQEIRHTNTLDGNFNPDGGLFTKVISFIGTVDE